MCRVGVDFEIIRMATKDTWIPRRKLVIVGDHVGKTNLLIMFSENRFAGYLPPCPFQNFVADIDCEGKTVELALWDTAAQEDYDRIRALSYPDADVVLICYSIVQPESLENVPEKASPHQQHPPPPPEQ